jgi:hypothetical protein
LWIDRICINQANNDEQNAAVAIKLDIHRGAVWAVSTLLERKRGGNIALFIRQFRIYEMLDKDLVAIEKSEVKTFTGASACHA